MSTNRGLPPPPSLPPPPTLSRAQSHQKGTITSHWNDLPSAYIPSPSSSRTTSRNNSRLNTPSNNNSSTDLNVANSSGISIGNRRGPSPLTTITTIDGEDGVLINTHVTSVDGQEEQEGNKEGNGEEEQEEEEELKSLEVLLPALYNLPTTLPRGEHSLLQGRINKFLLPAKKSGGGAVGEDQRLWVRDLLQRFVVRESLTAPEAREEIVSFMRAEQGVASWAGSVRRVVECVVPKGGAS